MGQTIRSSIPDQDTPVVRAAEPAVHWKGDTALAKPVSHGTSEPKMLSAYMATARAAAMPPPTPTEPVAEATRNASIPKPTPSRATASTVTVRLPRLRTTPCDGPTTTIAIQMAAATTN